MLRPNAKRWSPAGAASLANGPAYRLLTGIPNGHLHLALVAALITASLIALVIPIARTRAGESSAPPAPARAVASDALAAALQVQAQMVTGALVSPLSAQMGSTAALGLLSAEPGVALIPRPLVVAAARLAARGAFVSPQAQTAFARQRDEPVGFTLHENGFASSQRSVGLTVGQALAVLGIRVGPHDLVSPLPETELSSGQHIFVQYANPVAFIVAGQEQEAYTRAATVGGLLAEAGIQVQPMDLVYPDVSQPIHSGMTVSIVTVRDVEAQEDSPLEFDTVYQYDADLLQGSTALLQAGSNGYVRRQYRIRQVNSHEARRELVAETTVAPTAQVIAIGTYVPATPAPQYAPAAVAPAGDASCASSLHVWATWYNAASAGGSTTATGTGVYRGIVAVDPRVIPLGTQMYIPGYGYGLAADTGGGVRGSMIDLGFGAGEVSDWHTRWVDICILGP